MSFVVLTKNGPSYVLIPLSSSYEWQAIIYQEIPFRGMIAKNVLRSFSEEWTESHRHVLRGLSFPLR